MADLKRIDPSTVRPDGGKTALSPPERRCHTTHHTGCVCWEATRDAKLAAAESRATRAEQDADALAAAPHGRALVALASRLLAQRRGQAHGRIEITDVDVAQVQRIDADVAADRQALGLCRAQQRHAAADRTAASKGALRVQRSEIGIPQRCIGVAQRVVMHQQDEFGHGHPVAIIWKEVVAEEGFEPPTPGL